MDKTFYKKIIKFKSFLIDNFKIIDNDVTKRNRKINFNHIIYLIQNLKLSALKFLKFYDLF